MAKRVESSAPVPHRRDGWWLTLIVYTALLVRVHAPWRHVLGGEQVAFQGHDAWYHMRLVDHLIRHFPRPLAFDPFAVYPGGQEVGVAPLLDLLVAGVARGLGAGEPSARLVDTVGAWTPAILGALVPLAVYAVGRLVFDRRVGLLAAGLLAVQPGQFLMRSLLGFVDHHVLETLLATTTVALLLAAVKRDREDEANARSSAGAAALAGLALGGYLLSWGGGSLLVAIFSAWLVVQHVLDHVAGKSSAWQVRVVPVVAATAAVFLVPWWNVLPRAAVHGAALAGLGLVPLLLAALERLATRLGTPRALYPLGVVATGVAGAVVASALWPGLAGEITSYVLRFVPSSTTVTVSEARPLWTGGAEAMDTVWLQYRSAFALGLAGLGILVLRMIRHGARPGETLLVVWSGAMLLAALAQNRFGYYLDVNLCLLVGMLCHFVLGRLGRRGWPVKRGLLRVTAAGALVLLAFLPTLRPVLEVARTPFVPSREWFDALHWLRRETPEPLATPEAYFQRFEPPPEGRSFDYPPSAYGVLSWWDYGYWISRIGRRIPTANPTQRGAETAARFFTATRRSDALRVLREAEARYVITHADLGAYPDPATGMVYGLLPAMTEWADLEITELYDVYWEPGPGGVPKPSFFFHPAFYRTMAIHLTLFGGEEIFATHASWVIETRRDEVVSARRFETYDEAREFLDATPPGTWRLVGRDPRYPCVPLPALRGLRQVHQEPADVDLPVIRIFEASSGS